MRTPFRILISLLVVTGLVAAACGRDDGDTTTTPADNGETDDDGEPTEAAGPADPVDCDSYDASPGVTDDAILIGSSFPQSGLFAAFAEISAGYEAYLSHLNDQGGVRGRSIELVTRDDEYTSSRTLSNYESLVESDGVFALFNVVGTPNNLAIRDQQNEDCVPNLFLATGSQFWGNPDEYPWTIGSIPTYPTEMAVFVDYLQENAPDAQVAVLYQNDDFGEGYLDSFESLIGDTDIEMVTSISYDSTDQDVSPQMSTLAGSGADTLLLATTALACPTALAALDEVNWDPLTYISATCTSSTLVGLAPEGSAVDVLSAFYLKDPANPAWDDDPAMVEFREIGAANGLSSDQLDNGVVAYGWTMGQLLAHTLENAEDLTRADVMNAAWSLDGVEFGLLLPGITVTTDGADNPFIIEAMSIGSYNGEFWDLEDELYDFEGRTSDFTEID
jgi:branched-chain amino acid transport system substrate-binding protein